MNGTRGNDSAVSPVVGVMLMLVVTIIIASVISAYAGGLGGTREKAPQVTVAARINDSETIYFDHMGGDGLSIDDLAIILDQGDQRLRITDATINRPDCEMKNKAGSDVTFIRSGDTIVLSGKDESGVTNFSIKGTSQPISIEHNKEFTWTLLSQRGDAIMARGTLAF
ncbi:MAG: type IV pilin N-terminal domain-containing protein [Methanoregulaceae archaeon]|jgi:FlaG/FlaF family flagellin (archaellin)